MSDFKRQLVDKLQEFCYGDPWVTENFQQRILSLNSMQAVKKFDLFSHTIAEIVNHMSAWRNFAAGKLMGDKQFDIKLNTSQDWPPVLSWEDAKEGFVNSQTNLVHAINGFADDQWKEVVPLRTYAFDYLLDGIIKHDYYHYGQIGCILAAQPAR